MRTLAAIAVLLTMLGASDAAAGQVPGRGGDGRPTQERGRGGQMSPGQAAEMARRQTGGRVLSVDAGQNGYRVKVLTPSGEVRYVWVPSGR
jgi:hypothetical protein